MSDLGLFYDRQGKPISVEEWSRLKESGDYFRIGEETLVVAGEPVWVSTVWLGIDHGFGRRSRPIIFETMIFGADGSPWDQETRRYATEDAARAGHEETVALLRLDAEAESKGTDAT